MVSRLDPRRLRAVARARRDLEPGQVAEVPAKVLRGELAVYIALENLPRGDRAVFKPPPPPAPPRAKPRQSPEKPKPASPTNPAGRDPRRRRRPKVKAGSLGGRNLGLAPTPAHRRSVGPMRATASVIRT